MKEKLPALLIAVWDKIPFRELMLIVILLYQVKEQFPFSNFPMYSNFDTEADVVFVADQIGNALPMDEVFRSGSSTAKKAYKKELGKIVNPQKRDSEDATQAERSQAGAIVLGDWHANMRRERLPAGTTAIRLYRRNFELKDGKLADDTPELLAEMPL